MRTIEERVLQAAECFIERRGYEIIEHGFSCEHGAFDIIATEEDGELVFIEVLHKSDGGFAESMMTRTQRELVSIEYLKNNPQQTDICLRFDVISIAVFDEDKAMLRHHVRAQDLGL